MRPLGVSVQPDKDAYKKKIGHTLYLHKKVQVKLSNKAKKTGRPQEKPDLPVP